MKNRTLRSNLLLDSIDDLYISMVVLLQELIVKTLSNLTFENSQDLLDSLKSAGVTFTFLIGWQLLGEALDDLALISLVLLIADIESDLVSIQILILVLGELLHERSRSLWDLEVELALCDLVVVKVTLIISVLVDQEKKSKHLSSEVLLVDDLLSKAEGVTKVLLHVLPTEFDGLFDFVKSARLESNSNNMFVSLIIEASSEHFVDDSLHLWVDGNRCLASLCRVCNLLLVHHLLLELDVLVNAFVDELLNVLALIVEIKLIA